MPLMLLEKLKLEVIKKKKTVMVYMLGLLFFLFSAPLSKI